MSWMKTINCPVCGADGFEPDCDGDVVLGEGNLRGLCRNCGEVCERGDDEPGFVAEFPSDRTSCAHGYPDDGECSECVALLREGIDAVIGKAGAGFVSREAAPAEVVDLGAVPRVRCPFCRDRVGGCPHCWRSG